MQLPGEFSPFIEKSGFLISGRGVTPPYILSGPTTKVNDFFSLMVSLRELPAFVTKTQGTSNSRVSGFTSFWNASGAEGRTVRPRTRGTSKVKLMFP